MLSTPAEIVAREGQQVHIRAAVQSGCAACSQSHCASRSLSQAMGHKQLRLSVATTETFEAGENCFIHTPEKPLLAYALWVWGMPLTGLFLGVLLAVMTGYAETGQLFGAILGLAMGFLCIAHVSLEPRLLITKERKIHEHNG